MTADSPVRSAEQPVLDRQDALTLALIAGMYLGLVGTALDWHGYWSDEFHTIHAVKLPIVELVRQRASSGHPPLFFLLEKAWVAIAGTSEAGSRSLPMLCGLCTLLLTYLIVRRESGRLAAAAACGLLATSATQLMICQLARSYALLQLLVTAEAALVLSRRPTTAARLAASALLSAAAMYTHGAALVAVPAQMAAVAVALPSQWRYLLSSAAGALAYLPFLLAHPTVDNVEVHLDWVPPPTFGALLRFPALLQFGKYVEIVPPVILAGAVLIFVALAIGGLRQSDQSACLALHWFFTWSLAAAAGGWGLGIIGVERYFAPAVVCQAMFSAMIVSAIAYRGAWQGKAVGGVLAAIALASAGLYVALPPFPPWREMAALIERERSAGEVVFVQSPEVLATPFTYYYRGEATFNGANAISLHEAPPGLWVCGSDRSGGAAASIEPEAVRMQFDPPIVYPFHRGEVRRYRRLSQQK